ncbi:hypothetical protein, partial [Falsiroseomonas selenitidurans]
AAAASVGAAAGGAASGGGAAALGTATVAGLGAASASASANLTQGSAGAQALEALGQDALAQAELLGQMPRNPLDSCALSVFKEMTRSSGFAVAQSWVRDLTRTATDSGDAVALGGVFTLVGQIRGGVRRLEDSVRTTVLETLDLPRQVETRDAFTAASDLDNLCPAGVMGRLAELTLDQGA